MPAFNMTKRTVAFGIALGLAGISTAGVLAYLRGVESRAFAGVQTVQAYVAKDTIPSGTKADTATANGLIVRQTMPRVVIAEGAIRTLDQIKGKVAAVNIQRGEQILISRFQAPGLKGRLQIPADRQAMSVEVALPPGVAGYVQVGDHVSIVAQLAVSKAAGSDKAATETRVQYLLQNIEVLAIGQRIVVVPGEREEDVVAKQAQQQQAQTKVMMTLALSPAELEKLAYAIMQGEVYFALLPPGQENASTPGRTAENAFQ